MDTKRATTGLSEGELTFEAAMQRLEEIVQRLEDGEVSLEEAIELFQEGMRLSRWCDKKLRDVEQRIDLLLEEEDGGFRLVPFTGEEDEA
ncbi:MAG TPA: exodeoxyribonuclease VII small subunit [Calditerricola sp.]